MCKHKLIELRKIIEQKIGSLKEEVGMQMADSLVSEGNLLTP